MKYPEIIALTIVDIGFFFHAKVSVLYDVAMTNFCLMHWPVLF